MRLRYVKDADKKIASYPQYVLNIPRNDIFVLNNAFKDQKPLHIEIGTGKGQFIHTLAKRNPNINFIGVEKFNSAIVKALDKVLVEPFKNLYLVRMDAEQLGECLESHSVETIYLNFSDPWPKDRHEKRRLTSADFLKLYKTILVNQGKIVLKTDNRSFFEYSVMMFHQEKFRFESISLNLHEDKDPKNIMTEYEEKFSKEGPIYQIKVRYQEETER